jgi:phage gp45-like
MFTYTGTNYNWGPTQYLCIVGASQGALQDVSQDASQEAMQNKSVMSMNNDVLIYSTTGQQIKVWTSSENTELTNATVRIYNSTGSLVYTQRMSSNEMIIDLDTVAGLYIVEVGGVKRKVVISPLAP